MQVSDSTPLLSSPFSLSVYYSIFPFNTLLWLLGLQPTCICQFVECSSSDKPSPFLSFRHHLFFPPYSMLIELQIQELENISNNALLRDRCQRRVETCADKLLASFVETNAYHRAHQLTLALFAQDAAVHPSSSTSSHHHNPSLMIDFVVGLDALAVVCCVLLAESPPPPKFSSVSVERDLNRIRSGAIAARQNRGGARAGLQLDIDRLFAQQIRVFEGASLTSPTLDAVLGTVLKASFKSAQEYSRLHTFYGVDRNHHCLLVQAEMTFVKQCASAVLRDPSACDALVDQVLSGLAARQADKDGTSEELTRIGSSSNDSHDDVMTMSRIVNDRLASICTRSVLLPRS